MALDNLMGGALWISIAGMGFSVILSLYNLWLNYKQSKGGFLRRMMNTLRQEHIQQQLEPPKKKFFGGQSENRGGGF